MNPIELCTKAQTELFGQGRVELLEELTTPDVVDHGAPPPNQGGRDGLRRPIQWIHSGLDDVRYEVHDAFANGDRVAIRCTMHGNQKSRCGNSAVPCSISVDS